MVIKFLNRIEEMARVQKAWQGDSSFVCLYGRRRTGKTRLLNECLKGHPKSVYVCGDLREKALQIDAAAKSISDLLEGFDSVRYPGWDSLLDRWWNESPNQSILVLDEFPWFVQQSPELPSLLQKKIDRPAEKIRHLAVCGSSQRLMQGLILDAAAPLFGRAHQILKLLPLKAGWIGEGLKLSNSIEMIEYYAVFGGIPRYWELARQYDGLYSAIGELIVNPLGVLYQEPIRLLADDIRDTVQASSILSVVGQGCNRLSEIAARLGKQATAIARPLQKLIELGLLKKETPFGASERSGKKSLYKIGDPFLSFWFAFVEPNHNLIEAGQQKVAMQKIKSQLRVFTGKVWEELAMQALPNLEVAGQRWISASRWWGAGKDKQAMEIDFMAKNDSGNAILIGEAKMNLSGSPDAELSKLADKGRNLPFATADTAIVPALFVAEANRSAGRHKQIFNADDVLTALK